MNGAVHGDRDKCGDPLTSAARARQTRRIIGRAADTARPVKNGLICGAVTCIQRRCRWQNVIGMSDTDQPAAGGSAVNRINRCLHPTTMVPTLVHWYRSYLSPTYTDSPFKNGGITAAMIADHMTAHYSRDRKKHCC